MIPQVKNENELRKLAGLPLKEMGESLDNILAKHREAFESVMMGQSMLYDHDTFFDELYEYFVNSGEMPYGIAKARDGDPDQWIQEYLEQEYGDDFATDDERAMDAQKAQMPASLGGSLKDRSADMGSTQVTKQLSQYHTKEEIDNGEGINESEDELKAWYDKYNKYRSADVRNLADGMFDYYLSSGVDLDAAEKGEYEALVKKYGEDKVSGRVMKYLNEMPITKAMFIDFKKIMGSVREDTVEKAVDMLGESKKPKTFKEHLDIVERRLTVDIPGQPTRDLGRPITRARPKPIPKKIPKPIPKKIPKPIPRALDPSDSEKELMKPNPSGYEEFNLSRAKRGIWPGSLLKAVQKYHSRDR